MEIISIQRPESGKLTTTIRSTPSKSETNRALIIGAISDRNFTVMNPSLSDDSLVLVEALNTVGITTELVQDGFLVSGCVKNSTTEEKKINLRMAGSALRFFLPLSIFLRGNTIIDCDEQLRRRPIKALIDSLRNVGAEIEYLVNEGELPVKVFGETLITQVNFTVDVSQTSQMLSGIMLVASFLEPLTRIYLNKPKIVSHSYAELTREILQSLGIQWEWKTACYELKSNKITSDFYEVGGDWSSASYWLGLASTIQTDMLIENLSYKSLQGDSKLFSIFSGWKLDLISSENGIFIINLKNNIVKPFEIDFSNMPDSAPTFAVLATFTDGLSCLRGLNSLVYKESNRIESIATELNKLGQETKTASDMLKITARPMSQSDAVDVYSDHRLAMSFSILANKLDFIEIENPNVVEKSYPNFWDDLSNAGYRIRRKKK